MEHTEDCRASTEAFNDPCSCTADQRRPLDPRPILVYLVLPSYDALEAIESGVSDLLEGVDGDAWMTLDRKLAKRALRGE